MSTRMISGYVMGPTLGAGGFSKVRLGATSSGEHVALKILNKEKMSTSSSIVKQVEREITAMSKIQHPNVIKLFHVDWNAVYTKKNGKQRSVILVVLELAQGGELFEMLAFSGSFEEVIARSYFHQLVDALLYCHTQGIAHRDLKPENLLMDGNFQLKIADFGFAQAFTSSSMMHTECGTPGYMAPEMFKHQGYEAIKTDIWASGVILFIMIAGFPPFQRPAMTDWWFNKLANNKHHLFWEAHSRSAYFSDLLKDLINRLLAVDPAKRISLTEVQQHAWFRGDVVPASVLTTEMSKRKMKVDEAKRREKGVAHANAAAAVVGGAAVGGGAGALEDGMAVERALGSTMEAIDPDSADLPLQPPSNLQIDLRLPPQKEDKDTAPFDRLPSGSLFNPSAASASSSSSSSSSSTSSSSPSCQPPLLDPSAPSVLTRFTTSDNSGGRFTFDRMVAALEKMGGRPSLRENDFKLRTQLPGTGVDFTVQIYRKQPRSQQSSQQQQQALPQQHTNGAYEHLVVECRKRNGDATIFRKLFANLRSELEDIIVFTDPATTSS